MRLLTTSLLATAAAVVVAGNAHAAALTATTILQDFNAVIYDNASTQSDIDGAAVIGGNFKGTTVYLDPPAALPTGFGALDVFGTLSGIVNVNSGGNLYAAKGDATVNFNGGGNFIQAPSDKITNFETPLNALSLSLSKRAATATLSAHANNEVITAVPGANHIAVFNITAAQLAALTSFSVNLNGASTVVFNVAGAAPKFQGNDANALATGNHVIWNFYDATGTVNIDSELGGTVLATNATVKNTAQIDGTLVAKDWIGDGALYDYDRAAPKADFSAVTMEADLVARPGPAVPEPASLGLLAAGALGLCAARRRRRAAAAG